MTTKKNIFIKAAKIIGVVLLLLLSFLILVPIIFSDAITEKVKVLANEKLEGKLDFKESNLSFFTHFPSLTLTLTDFNLMGSAPFKNQELLTSKEIGFGIDVSSLIFGSETQIDEIFLNDSKINILVDKKGNANYNIVKPSNQKTKPSENSASLNLKSIQILNSHLIYNDASSKIIIDAKSFDYKGKGNLLANDFKLDTDASIGNLTFSFDQKEYLKNKTVKAELITKINTKSLAFIFEKNDLKINKLPVAFSGFFNFLSNGYTMNFDLKTENRPLEDLFTALPAEYVSWMKKTELKGETSAEFSLKGNYIVTKKQKPAVNFKIKLRDGFVKNEKAIHPIENIYLNLETKLPNLDINQLDIKLDSLYFTVKNTKLAAILKSTGYGKKMLIDTKIKSTLNLDLLNQALKIPNYTINGQLNSNIISKGTLDLDSKKLPITNGYLHLTNGRIKTAYYPKPIEKINLKANLSCSKGSFSDASLVIQPSEFVFEKQPINIAATFANFIDVNYKIMAKGKVNLGNIYKVFSQKGLSVKGFINADLSLAGKQSDATNKNYQNLKNKGTLELINILTSTSYLPKPFLIQNGLFRFDQDKMNFTNFKGKYGQSDVLMNGYLENVINFVLSKNETIRGNFSFQSNYLNVEEFLSKEKATIDTQENKITQKASVIEIPKNIDVNLQAQVDKIDYEELTINGLKGGVSMSNGILKLNNGSLNIAGAQALMNGQYKNEGKEKAVFDYSIKADNFDIKRVYNEVKLFRELASAAEHAEGIISLDYKINGVLNNEMLPIMPSLAGGGTISVSKVKMKGYRLLNAVAEKTNFNVIKDPDVSKVDIKSTIKNNIINIEQFKIKVALFRIRFEGQTSFDGKLNLKTRVGLPPLGLIGIPLKITGDKDKPKIKLGKKSEDLEETEYKE